MNATLAPNDLVDYLKGNGCETAFKAEGRHRDSPWQLIEIKDADNLVFLRPCLRDVFNAAGFRPGLMAFSVFGNRISGSHLAVFRDNRSSYFRNGQQANVLSLLFPRGRYDRDQALDWAARSMTLLVGKPLEIHPADPALQRRTLKRMLEAAP